MAKKKMICVMDGCDKEQAYKESKLCSACYAFMYYWQDRSVTDRMNHVHKIERWNARAHSALIPAKVTSIRTKRTTRRKAG